MTFDQIVSEVLGRTRQTSTEARERIGRAVNDRHRRVTSALGVHTSRRTETQIILLGGPPALPTPAAPVVEDAPTPGTYGGWPRFYRVRWTSKEGYTQTTARSDPSPATGFVPSGTADAARILRPSPVPPGANVWEIESFAVNDKFYRIAQVASVVTFFDDRLPVDAIITFGTLAEPLAAISQVTKVLAVTDPVRQRVLGEVTFDEWRERTTTSPTRGPAEVYAVDTMQSRELVLRFHPWPATDDRLLVDGVATAVVLESVLEPVFSADYHDLLVHGALSDEWMQLKQDDLSRRSEAMFEQRLADLRMFIAKSAYLDIYQGKRAGPSGGAYWPGYAYRGRY